MRNRGWMALGVMVSILLAGSPFARVGAKRGASSKKSKVSTLTKDLALEVKLHSPVIHLDSRCIEAYRQYVAPKGQPMRCSSPDLMFTATLVNRGKRKVTLVKPGDGSESRMRTPQTGWSLLKADEKGRHPVSPPGHMLARCGNQNGLERDEVFVLLPGESKEIKGYWGLLEFPGPGKYHLVLYYFNDPAIPWSDKSSRNDPVAFARMKTSSPCALVSNEIAFSVEMP